MKFRILFTTLAVAASMLATACSKDPSTDKPEDPETPVVTPASVSVSPRELQFQAENASAQTVQVTASEDYWVVAPAQNARWISAIVRTKDSNAKEIAVSVSDNDALEARSGYVYVTLDDARDSVLVTQIGQAPVVSVSEEKCEVTAEAQTIEVSVLANVAYDVTVSEECDWMVASASSDGATITLTVQENVTYEPRQAVVTLVSDKIESNPSFEVVQAAAAERVRVTNDIFVPFASAETASSASTNPVEYINDNNLNTSWQTPSRGVTSPAEITFSFGSEPVTRVDYAVYYPSTPYGQFGQVDVYYTNGTDEQIFVGSYDMKMADTPDTMSFGEAGLSFVKTITLKIKTANGRETSTGVLAGIAELEFFRTPVLRDITEIFTDYSCSELRPDVTYEMTKTIPDTLYRRIAMGLADGSYDTEFRVATYNAYPHPDTDSEKFKTNTYTKWDNITGMCITRPGTYHIAVDVEPSAAVQIDIINWETNCYGNNVAYTLHRGINTITVAEKKGSYLQTPGIIYLRYHTENFKTATPIKVHFMDADVNGYFNAQTTDPARFEKLLENTKAPEFDMISRRSIITMPVSLIKANTKTGERAKQLLAITDTIVALEEDIQGHLKYNTGGHRNRMIFRPIYPTRDANGNITSSGSYMYSTSYATGYNVSNDAGATICNPDKLANGIWGPAHEVGHSNQLKVRLKWTGTTEVTNNICSAFVMYTLGGSKAANAETSITGRDAFNTGIRDIALSRDKTISHFSCGSWDNIYYSKAAPFWQLYLYYTYVGGYPDLYRDIYNTLRNMPTPSSTPATNGQAVMDFCKLVCDLTKTDLTEFFEFWRLLYPTYGYYISDYGGTTMTVTQEMVDEVKAYISQYPKPKHKIQYLSEHNIDLFINPQSAKAGSMKVSTTYVSATGFSNVVAFELCDGPDETVAVFLPKVRNTTGATLYNRYSKIIWSNSSGVQSPDGKNSSTYYNSSQQLVTVPTADYTPYVYGVLADGTRIPADGNPTK